MSRYCVFASVILIWLAAVMVPIGEVEVVASPRFFESHREMLMEDHAKHPEAELGPALLVSMPLRVPIAMYFGLVLGATFTAGVIAVRALTVRKRSIGLLVAAVLWTIFLVGSINCVRNSMWSFRWGFNVYGFAYLVLATALGLGVIGSAGQCLVTPKKRAYLELADGD